jgi:hypothetical protein
MSCQQERKAYGTVPTRLYKYPVRYRVPTYVPYWYLPVCTVPDVRNGGDWTEDVDCNPLHA